MPVAWYVDRAWYEREMHLLFERGPNYAGHERMVPKTGDYLTLPWMDDRKVLVRDQHGVNLLVQRAPARRQARLLDGRGHVQNIVCPVHRWTYDLGGRLLGAPDFDQTPQCSLPSTRLANWRGLLFRLDRAIRTSTWRRTSRWWPITTGAVYVFDRTPSSRKCPSQLWKEFLEIFLELYHVEAAHPGLEMGRRRQLRMGLLATVGAIRSWASTTSFESKPRPTTRNTAMRSLSYLEGRLPKYGTVWSVLYPNVMIEWYPFALVVSTGIPRGPDHTTNVAEFYYPEEVQAFERQIVEAHQACYAESAAEDARICVRLHEGRRALWLAGEDVM